MTTPAIVRLDDDDPMLQGYKDLSNWPHDWEIIIADRIPLGDIYNSALNAMPDLEWYGFLADDVVPETFGWDRLLIKAAGSFGLAFGDDGINGETRATHFVLGGDLVRRVGYLALPGLDRTYIDTVWNDIAHKRVVSRYLPDVKMTHKHFSNRTALMDQTYRKPAKARDRALYQEWRNTEDVR